ncbi:MAG: hypothetical protein NTW01_08315 [Gammaproteobacteria bacterium]|uniref:hypothetical protein n=1 Tax=Nevskia sp. TaxID=1929292 RepID=UPI0040369B72|nr:hypothetical protein [Gammaproteobacteria bacterium]
MNRDAARAALRDAVAAELALPLPPAIVDVAEMLAARGHGAATAVLFYGSNLRSGALDGVLDYYVLVDSLRGWYGPGRWLPAAANRILPPSILYLEPQWQGQTLRAKVAVLRADQFRRAMRRGGLDTTMWARYSQPAALAWHRDAASRDAAVAAVTDAVISAAGWAGRLGPAIGVANDYWQALFKRTYGAELRVEKASRTDSLMAYGGERYDRLLPLAWAADSLRFETLSEGRLRPAVSTLARRLAGAGWSLRHLLGKPLNFVRLMKSAYTFDGGVDYVLWKIERHSGVRMELTPWQRRHPILASPYVLWQLRKRGAIR